MTTVDECVHCDQLTLTIEAAHERALVALTSPGAGRFDAVVWLSAHLAAVEHVVTPLLDRHVPRDATTRRDERRMTRALHRSLRALEQVTAADALATHIDVTRLRAHLVTLLTEHAAAEHLLVQQLARSIGPDRTAKVCARYQHALEHGPTRPHPHSPRGRGVDAAVFTFGRARDRLLDVLDSRHVPTQPAPHRPAPPGRWG